MTRSSGFGGGFQAINNTISFAARPSNGTNEHDCAMLDLMNAQMK